MAVDLAGGVPNLKLAIDFITTVQKETAKKNKTYQKGELHCMFCKAKWFLNGNKFTLKLDLSKRSYQPTTTILTKIFSTSNSLCFCGLRIFFMYQTVLQSDQSPHGCQCQNFPDLRFKTCPGLHGGGDVSPNLK